MSPLKAKFVRDPVHGEIEIYPLERLVCDTPGVQRLRKLSQLSGAVYTYPGATHNRFAHALGAMHLSGMYARRLFEGDWKKIFTARLAGLLHDIGHGPFSHQFDDTVYKRMGFKRGHDDYRHELLGPDGIIRRQMVEKLESDPGLRRQVFDQFKMMGLRPAYSSVDVVLDEVLKILEGSNSPNWEYSVLFNMVQGPIGADRMDFLLRDVYYSGFKGVGEIDAFRIIRHTAVKEHASGRRVLAYHRKNLDILSSFLFTRYMMYKHVYFHKTSRSADIMIQQMLDAAYDVLNLKAYVEDQERFMLLSDAFITERIKHTYELWQDGLIRLQDDKVKALQRAYKILLRLEKRDLYKPFVDQMKYVPEEEIKQKSLVAQDELMRVILEKYLERLRAQIEDLLGRTTVEDGDRIVLEDVLERFDEIFIADTPYYITVFDPREFTANDVFLFDGEDVWSLAEYLEVFPDKPVIMQGVVYLLRIYLTEDVRNVLRKYGVGIESGKGEAPTTLW